MDSVDGSIIDVMKRNDIVAAAFFALKRKKWFDLQKKETPKPACMDNKCMRRTNQVDYQKSIVRFA